LPSCARLRFSLYSDCQDEQFFRVLLSDAPLNILNLAHQALGSAM
jgi:hypothetical protein